MTWRLEFFFGASPLIAPETANQREKSTGKTYQPERPLAIKKTVCRNDCGKLSGCPAIQANSSIRNHPIQCRK
ncbi:MAG: hypothetical protein CVU68_05730 [Deltaproteobacteria bacterium HGW-Deltaproteobacteria-3]|nr:MAG: hypothetical protein CVU68_05730 [Deltaproteobacteria bacterium HGW-Deltaproteobacteria-3]